MAVPIASRVYDGYARFYDVFEMLFKRRLARAIGAVPFEAGSRVLDIGVGTGLSLAFYPPQAHVTGIDLSAAMLKQAERKLDQGLVRADCPRSHTRLLRADAMQLPFADGSFDVVLLSHVISTVPNPDRCLAEALRVVSDGGVIVLVNHFRSRFPLVNWVETAIDPICRKLGWRSDLSLTGLLARAGVEHARDAHKGVAFLFRIVYLQKSRARLRVVRLPERGDEAAALDTAR
jgi:phosphatidylethanolamine/phosphatidyl-N-methylethanolamine N-methyltransferase